MGCCESSEKNSVHPHGKAGPTDVKIRIDPPADDDQFDLGKRHHDDPTETPSSVKRVRTSRPPEPPPEVEVVNTIPLNGHTQNVDLCAWSPTADLLLTAGTDRKLFLWDLTRSTEVAKPKAISLSSSSDNASCIDWSQDGKNFVVGTEKGFVILYDPNGSSRSSWRPHSGSTDGTKAARVANGFVVSVGECICLCHLGDKSWSRFFWSNSYAPLTHVEWITEDQFLAADLAGCITLDRVDRSSFSRIPETDDRDNGMDLDERNPQAEYHSHDGGIYKVIKHPSHAKIFASCSVDFTIKIWSLDSKIPLKTLEGHFGFVVDIAWIGATDRIASGSFDGSVRIWDSRSGECKMILEENRDRVAKISVSPDGWYVASAGLDGTINFWNIATGKHANNYEGPGRMMQVQFNHTGNFVVATSYGVAEILNVRVNRAADLMSKELGNLPREQRKFVKALKESEKRRGS